MKKSVILALVISFAFAAVACNDGNDEQNPSTEITKNCMDANTLQVCYKGTCNTQKCEAGCGLGNDNVARCLEKTYTRPLDVPEICDATSKGICGSDGNAWLCNIGEGKYYTNAGLACSQSVPCVACNDGTAGCGISCNSSSNKPERPEDVPETCDKCNDKGMCGSDHNGWLCGDTGYYTTNALTCPEDKPCVDCDGFIGCGIVCDPPRPTNVPETCAAGDPGICDPSGLYAWTCDKTAGKYKVNNRCSESKPCVACDDGYVGCVADDGKEEFCKTCTDAQNECINNGKQAHVCSKGHLKTWSCAEPCSIDEATRKVTCSNGCSNSNGNTTERPANVPESCTQRQDPGICGDDGNAWFCGNSGYYLNNSGKCTTDKPCVVCPDGYAGCDADKETFCAKHQKK